MARDSLLTRVESGRYKVVKGTFLDTHLEHAIKLLRAHFHSRYNTAIRDLHTMDGLYLSFLCVLNGIEALAGLSAPRRREWTVF
jgi:hypothetical protein